MRVWRSVAWEHERHDVSEARVHNSSPAVLKRARVALRGKQAARRARSCVIWPAWIEAVEAGETLGSLPGIRPLAPQSWRDVLVYMTECGGIGVHGHSVLGKRGLGIWRDGGHRASSAYPRMTLQRYLVLSGGSVRQHTEVARRVRRRRCGKRSGAGRRVWTRV